MQSWLNAEPNCSAGDSGLGASTVRGKAMGANVFYTRAIGKNADDAFWAADAEANSAYGYDGYTGTIPGG